MKVQSPCRRDALCERREPRILADGLDAEGLPQELLRPTSRSLTGRFNRQGVKVGGDPLEQFHQRCVLFGREALHHPDPQGSGLLGNPLVRPSALAGQCHRAIVSRVCPAALDEPVDVWRIGRTPTGPSSPDSSPRS
ncbi:hypothetical protein ACWCRD_43350 [Streptomyces sp. NPDC002092]